MLKFLDRPIRFSFPHHRYRVIRKSNTVRITTKMCRLNECVNKECTKIIEQRGGEGGGKV